jgi:hypothetical protein
MVRIKKEVSLAHLKTLLVTPLGAVKEAEKTSVRISDNRSRLELPSIWCNVAHVTVLEPNIF